MQLNRRSNNASVHLVEQLGRGGEGVVYAIANDANVVAKIYSQPPAAEKIEKLELMARMSNASLSRAAAWPIDVLVDEQGEVRGLLMPRIQARQDIHELYSPRSRSEAFPEADVRFLVNVGISLARALDCVHRNGHVVGDLNHGNALVDEDGSVVLIDADSFQINAADRSYLCDVGAPLFTAPELHGRAFRGMHRTQNHDAFGLAVLLFQLLFMGRHPFAGRYSGGEMPIERAIREHLFAYDPSAASLGMSPPPFTLPLQTFGEEIAALFLRAFARAEGSSARPTPSEWIAGMEKLRSSLTACSVSVYHQFPETARTCCWCELELESGARLFGARVEFDESDLEIIWDQIVDIPHPGAPPELPDEAVRAYLAARANYGASAPIEMIQLMRRWHEDASAEPFDSALRKLAEFRAEVLELRIRRRTLPSAHGEQEQRYAFLNLFRIDRAALTDLSPDDIALLASYGIQTAADVQRMPQELGKLFSEQVAATLLSWLDETASGFRYEPAVPPEIKDLLEQIEARMRQLLDDLRVGRHRLTRIREDILHARTSLEPKLIRAAHEFLTSDASQDKSANDSFASGATRSSEEYGGCTGAWVFAILAIISGVVAVSVNSWLQVISRKTEMGFAGLAFLIVLGLAALFALIFTICFFNALIECQKRPD